VVKWRHLVTNWEIAGLFTFRFVYTACIGIIWGFLPVLADKDLDLSSTNIGFLVMLGILISGILQLPMGYVSDRINKKSMIVTGGLLVSYAVFSYTWADQFSDMVWASLLFGIGGGICMPALMATAVIIGDRTAAMGSVMAWLTVAHSMGMLAGSMLAGIMMDFLRLRAAFPVGAVLMLIGLAVLVYTTKHQGSLAAGYETAQRPSKTTGIYDEPIGFHHQPLNRSSEETTSTRDQRPIDK
jgi:MFS family permease